MNLFAKWRESRRTNPKLRIKDSCVFAMQKTLGEEVFCRVLEINKDLWKVSVKTGVLEDPLEFARKFSLFAKMNGKFEFYVSAPANFQEVNKKEGELRLIFRRKK